MFEISFSLASYQEAKRVREKYLLAYNGPIYIAKEGKKIVGFASFYRRELCRIYLNPKYRSVGIGKKFLSFVVNDYLSRTDVSILRARAGTSKKWQEKLEGWYKRSGAQQSKRYKDIFYFRRK
jgi:GNAT superfamily N-acetyltransferase